MILQVEMYSFANSLQSNSSSSTWRISMGLNGTEIAKHATVSNNI